MKTIFTIIFLFLLYQASAQPKFKNDSSYQPCFLRHVVDSIFTTRDSADFEFRLYMRECPLFGGNATVIILAFNRGQWSSHVYKLSFFPAEKFWEVAQKPFNVASLWQGLENDGVLTLPDNSVLKDKRGETAYSHTRDGTTYIFELTSRTARKAYSYYAPYGAIGEYPKIKEFARVMHIIEVMQKSFTLRCK